MEDASLEDLILERRTLFKGAAVATGGYLLGLAGMEGYHAVAEPDRYEKVENTYGSQVKTPDALYTFLYGAHGEEEEKQKLLRDADGIILEIMGNYTDYPEKTLDSLESHPQHEEILGTAKAADTPVFLGSTSPRHKPLYIGEPAETVGNGMEHLEQETPLYFTEEAEAFVKGLEQGHMHPVTVPEILTVGVGYGIGHYLLQDAYSTIREEDVLTRRDFTKVMGKGGAAAWFMLPAAAMISTVTSQQTGMFPEIAAEYNRVAHSTHPEMFPVTAKIREMVIAHKAAWLAENTFAEDPHLVTVLGGTHTAITDHVQKTPEERIDDIASYDYLLDTVQPETVYQTVRLEHEHTGWETTETYEIPDLEELV